MENEDYIKEIAIDGVFSVTPPGAINIAFPKVENPIVSNGKEGE